MRPRGRVVEQQHEKAGILRTAPIPSVQTGFVTKHSDIWPMATNGCPARLYDRLHFQTEALVNTALLIESPSRDGSRKTGKQNRSAWLDSHDPCWTARRKAAQPEQNALTRSQRPTTGVHYHGWGTQEHKAS